MVRTNIRPSVQMVREVKLLKSFSDTDLGKLIAAGHGVNFEAHGNIIIEGEQSWGLYLILEGLVGVFKTNKITGDIYDLAHLRRGNSFGEMSLIDESPRSATVKALTDCQLFYISQEAFGTFLSTSEAVKVGFYENCIRDLAGRLRELDENYIVSQYQLWKIALKNSKEAA